MTHTSHCASYRKLIKTHKPNHVLKVSHMRETHDSRYESCAKVITSYDITIVSQRHIIQSEYNDDSQVRSHVRTMSQVTS